MINQDLKDIKVPNFYPSFWDDEKLYSFGKTKDMILTPGNKDIDQFYDIQRHVHFDYQYEAKPMDIIFLSYDEPFAEDNWKILKPTGVFHEDKKN